MRMQLVSVVQELQNALQRQRDAARASIAEERAPLPGTPAPNNTGCAMGAAEERHVTHAAAAPHSAQPEVQICMAPQSLSYHITGVLW